MASKNIDLVNLGIDAGNVTKLMKEAKDLSKKQKGKGTLKSTIQTLEEHLEKFFKREGNTAYLDHKKIVAREIPIADAATHKLIYEIKRNEIKCCPQEFG